MWPTDESNTSGSRSPIKEYVVRYRNENNEGDSSNITGNITSVQTVNCNHYCNDALSAVHEPRATIGALKTGAVYSFQVRPITILGVGEWSKQLLVTIGKFVHD